MFNQPLKAVPKIGTAFFLFLLNYSENNMSNMRLFNNIKFY